MRKLGPTAPTGQMMLAKRAAAEAIEDDLLVEPAPVGLARAKNEGKTLGRLSKTTGEQPGGHRCHAFASKGVSAFAPIQRVSSKYPRRS